MKNVWQSVTGELRGRRSTEGLYSDVASRTKAVVLDDVHVNLAADVIKGTSILVYNVSDAVRICKA